MNDSEARAALAKAIPEIKAFPFVVKFETGCVMQPGMDLRDWFAGQALAGWISALAVRRNEPGYSDEGAAYEASRLSGITADAMMEARKQTEAQS